MRYDNLYIKDDFKLRCIANTYVVVVVGETSKEFNGVINLSGTAPFLWEALKNKHSVDELVSALTSEYEVDEKLAYKSVCDFIEVLDQNGILK